MYRHDRGSLTHPTTKMSGKPRRRHKPYFTLLDLLRTSV